MQLGAVQMLAPSLAKFGPLGVKEFEVFDLPYIFPDKAALKKVLEGPVGSELFDKLKGKVFVGLSYWDNGFKDMTVNKPLRKPKDFQRLKMRIQSSKCSTRKCGRSAQFRRCWLSPKSTRRCRLASSMAAKIRLRTSIPRRCARYKSTVSDHGYIGYAVITNKKFWDGLPADIRQKLEEAMNEATAYNNEIAQKDNDDALAAIKASGKTEILQLSPAEKAEWRKALLPVHKEMESRIGAPLIAQIYKETGAESAK